MTALQYDGAGNAFLTSVDREDGGDAVAVYLGGHGGEVPANVDDVAIVVLESGVYVRGPADFVAEGLGALGWVGVPRPLPGGQTYELLPGTGAFATSPCQTGAGWIAALRDREGGPLLMRAPHAHGAELETLATADIHPEFASDDRRRLRGRRQKCACWSSTQ